MPAHLIAEEGPYQGLTLNLEDGTEWIIGRDPDLSDFVMEDSTVSRKHASLTKTEKGIFLKNLSRINPALINNKEATDPTLLKEGDKVQVGNSIFIFSEEEIPQSGEKPSKPQEKKGGYDDIFGDLDNEPSLEDLPPLIPPEEKEEEAPKEEKEEKTPFDTIFEDSSEEMDLPFDLLSETPLVLKVISGPNAGAEIGMEKGKSYVIGKDPNSSDIVFQDLSVSRNHARLSIDTDGIITIEDLESKNGVVVNGETIQEKISISPQDIVSLGTTVFLIIDREAPQETIFSPISSYEIQKPEEEASEEASSQTIEEKDWAKEPIPTKHLIIGGSLAAIFLIVFLSFFSLFKSKGIEVAQKEPLSEVEKALDKFKDVQFSYNPGSGKLFLVGHVLTATNYAEMRYLIDQIDFVTQVEDTVVIDEYVSKSMNDVLSQNSSWKGVNISASSPGKFVVTGYIEKNDQAAEISDYLKMNFPYLDRLQNKIVVEENLNTELQAMLQSIQLGGVTLQLANGEVVLSGRYNEEKTRPLKKLIKQMDQVHGVTSVKNFALATHGNFDAIDLSQNFQVGGSSTFDGRGYSAIVNGKIYTIGDLLEGMKVTEIEPSMILLEKDGLKYKIEYAHR